MINVPTTSRKDGWTGSGTSRSPKRTDGQPKGITRTRTPSKHRWTKRSCIWVLFPILLTASCGLQQQPPNVVLITADTLRADALGVYGSRCECTPSLDSLAERSTVFLRAVSPIGTTAPAHASIFTGLYPKSHGVTWNGDVLLDDYTTLAERLLEEGYSTAMVSSWRRLTADSGFVQGFESTEESIAVEHGLGALVEPPVRPARSIVQLARAWLENRPQGKPFFLWLHFNEAHSPYSSTRFSRQAMNDIGYEGELIDGASVKEYHAYTNQPFDETTRQALWALYQGRVAALDQQLGEFFVLLKTLNDSDQTAIVFTADHGQMAGDKGRMGHGGEIEEPVLRVPLMLRLPGTAPEQRSDRVSLVDLADTIADITSLPPSQHDQGRSILTPAPRHRPIFGQTRKPDPNNERQLRNAKTLVLYLDTYKYVRGPNGLQRFDLLNDPFETRPSPLTDAAWAVEIEKSIDRYALQTPLHGEGERTVGELPESLQKELEALGYL